LPKNSIEHILKLASVKEQNLIDGKTFISDEEASYLGVYVAQVSIELKMELIFMMNFIVGILVVALSSQKEFDYKEHIDDIVKLVWKGIVVSKHIDTLMRKAELFSKQSVIDLTIKNVKGEL